MTTRSLFRLKHAATLVAIVTLLSWRVTAHPADTGEDPVLPVAAVESVGFTVENMERAVAFYTGVLPFRKISDVEVSGRAYELLTGVFGARSRIVRLQLGGEHLELTEFLAPKGRAFPADLRANDRAFQHMAIVVRDLNDIDGGESGLLQRVASLADELEWYELIAVADLHRDRDLSLSESDHVVVLAR